MRPLDAVRSLRVAVLDAIDGAPVPDSRPVGREHPPRPIVRQSGWAAELPRDDRAIS